VSRANIPFLPRSLRLFVVALRTLHNAVYIALCGMLTSGPLLLLIFPLPAVFQRSDVPIACLYNPYSRNRVAEGGFCDPVRILLTVLSAWLKTRSIFFSISRHSPDLPPSIHPSTYQPSLTLRAWITRPHRWRAMHLSVRQVQ
jgi:hypothetical protein